MASVINGNLVSRITQLINAIGFPGAVVLFLIGLMWIKETALDRIADIMDQRGEQHIAAIHRLTNSIEAVQAYSLLQTHGARVMPEHIYMRRSNPMGSR